MVEFLSQYWPEVVLSLITAGALGTCKYAFNQMKNYKKLVEEKDQNDITNLIKKELEPIVKEIQNLKDDINKIQETHSLQLSSIVRSYRFRLIQLCKIYLDQEYITTSQFEQLSEFYKLYHDLGGNGQAKEYYEKTKELPIRDE